MRNYSLIKAKKENIMARKVDPNKLERIKEATINSIFRYGYRGMSITEVSKMAKVSAGYLYRYYESKEQLIHEIVTVEFKEVKDSMRVLLEESTSLKAFIYDFVGNIFELVSENPTRAKLAAVLIFDIEECAFNSDEELGFKRKFENKLLELGRRNGELHTELTEEDVILILTTIVFRYVYSKSEADYNYFVNKENARKVAMICYNAMQNV